MTTELLEAETTEQTQLTPIANSIATRQMAEVQAAVVMAKKFPRNETAAIQRIVTACKRIGLAESSMYSYPRGGQQVTGPSIRLAEALAQAWGNLDFGIVELDQRDGESTVMAYCVDLESNTRQTKVFSVKHVRDTKTGQKKLSDTRDVYEIVANNGARRLRACILGVIPGDVIDTAIEQCERTLKDGNGEPLIDRIRKMVVAFGEFGVSQQMIEARLAHNIDATNEAEVVALKKIYVSLRDGMSTRDQWFTFEQQKQVKESSIKPSAAPAEKE